MGSSASPIHVRFQYRGRGEEGDTHGGRRGRQGTRGGRKRSAGEEEVREGRPRHAWGAGYTGGGKRSGRSQHSSHRAKLLNRQMEGGVNERNTSGGSKGERSRGAPPPYGPKFSQFHSVFRKICQNHRFAPPPWEGWRPLLRRILDPPLNTPNTLSTRVNSMEYVLYFTRPPPQKNIATKFSTPVSCFLS